MPDALVSANPTCLPILTRRSLLVGTTSLAATTLTAAEPAPRPAQSADELTALGERFERALATLYAVQLTLNDCERRYLDEGPDPPPILTSAGPLGHLVEDWAHWRARELRALMREPEYSASWRDARALLPMAQAYEARDRRFKRKLGLHAAERAYEAASNALEQLSLWILAAPVRSPASLAVKGRVVKVWGKPEWWSTEPWHADVHERLAAEIIDWVITAAREEGVAA